MWPLAAPCLTSNLNLAVLNQKGQIHLSQNVFTAAPAQTLVTPTFVTPLFFNFFVSWRIFSLSRTATMLISLYLALSSLMTLMSRKLSPRRIQDCPSLRHWWGRELYLVISCGKYVSVSFIIGYPFLKKAKALLCFGQIPAQDVPYDIIFWYVSKIIYLSYN